MPRGKVQSKSGRTGREDSLQEAESRGIRWSSWDIRVHVCFLQSPDQRLAPGPTEKPL